MDIDSIGERHGRAYHLPWELSKLGHQVFSLYIDYRSKDGCWRRSNGLFDISVCSLKGKQSLAFYSYFRELRRIVQKNRPNVIIAGSDALNIVIGHHAAAHLKVPFIADVKDDYSAFGMTRNVPFLKRFYYRSLKNADLVVCASNSLNSKLKSEGVLRRSVIENAVPTDFAPNLTKNEARKKLGLPTDHFLFGLAGALRESRDIATVIVGARQFLSKHDKAAFVMAGPRDEHFSVLDDVADQVFDFGQLPPTEVPLLFRSLDLGVIPNRPSGFGDNCYPQKYNEMLACGLPVCVSRVGVFDADPAPEGVACGYEPGNVEGFLASLKHYLHETWPAEYSAPSSTSQWSDRAKTLETNLATLKPTKNTQSNIT